MKKYLLAVSALTASFFTTDAFAAGYHLSEYTVTGLGRSFAGAGVVGDDFSSLAFNPAGMQYNQTNGAQTGVTAVSLHFDYKGSIGTAASINKDGMPSGLGPRSGSGHTRPTRVLPHVFAQQKLNDKTTLGLGVYVPYGLATDYDNDWFAQSHAGLSQLSATNVSPALSYQINDKFAIGGALNIQYVTARLTGNIEQKHLLYFDSAYNELEGDDYGVGYTLGTTFTPRKDIRLGVSYRSKIKHKLEGDLKISGILNSESDIYTKITTPEVVYLTAAYDLNKCFTLSATAKWTRWSQFKNLDIFSKTTGIAVSETFENWKNTWYYAVGADYRYNRNWVFRTGIGYDETVIKAPEYRTARIPDGRRILTSLGATWKKNNWQVDLGYMHIFVHGGEALGEASSASPANLKYSADADLVSFGVQYKF
ncbi:MAG: transporter [Alphaproteobacteria bacterium]|nr:transporter [Alphaproteobacteria bacterium]